jgi:hypothetical protein
MKTSVIGKFDSIETNELKIINENSSLKWSYLKKHKDIDLLNTGNTAKLDILNNGTKSIIADVGKKIGNESHVWVLKIHHGSVINIGLAEITKDLNSLISDNDSIYIRHKTINDTKAIISLSLTELKINYNNKTKSIDMTSFIGKTMYPWISGSNDGDGFSVTIQDYTFLKIYIEKGVAKLNTDTENGYSLPLVFDTGNSEINMLSSSIMSNGVNLSTSTTTPIDSNSDLQNIFDNTLAPQGINFNTTDDTFKVISSQDNGGKLLFDINESSQCIKTIELRPITTDINIGTEGHKFDSIYLSGNVIVDGLVDGIDIATDVAANTLKVSADGSVNTHSDFNITSPVDKNILQYDSSSNKWTNKPLEFEGESQGTVFSNESIESGVVLDTTQHIVNITTSGTITLPDRETNLGRQYIIINGSDGIVTVNRGGSDLIDTGLTSIVLNEQHDRLVLISSDTNWYTI